MQFFHQAFDLLPSNAPVDDLAETHSLLCIIYCAAGVLDQALTHSYEAIRYAEDAEDVFLAAQIRLRVAVTLTIMGHFADALAYANAALRNFQTYGDREATNIQEVQKLIEQIEQRLQPQGD